MNASTALELKSIEQHFHYLHENPAVAFEEHLAADYIAGKLSEWGYDVETGIGKTGVVGRLKVGNGKASVGLRADTDALPVEEAEAAMVVHAADELSRLQNELAELKAK